MAFQSLQFVIFFVCVLVLYYAVPARLRLWVLILANAVFFLWADRSAAVWLGISVLTTWGAGLFVQRLSDDQRKRRLVLVACLILNLGLLVLFKYLPVWDDLINARFGNGFRRVVRLDVAGAFGLATPLGISFYTLQAVGYLLDVSSGRYPAEKNLLHYTIFVSFFPNILSGPIERGGHFLPQIKRVAAQKRRELFSYDNFMKGGISVMLGLFMKMVIADRASLSVDYLYSVYQNGNSFTQLCATLFYSAQLYCDFASYSCIAVGLGRMLGFELIQNFRQPYFASGFSDFWKRWHISLSSWLRDYVYIPLGGNRKGQARKYGNLILVFLVSGLWHGGAPVFLLWGLGHGICQVLEDMGRRLIHAAKDGRKPTAAAACTGKHSLCTFAERFRNLLYRILSALFTFFVVSCLWILFRSDSVEMAKTCFVNLFTGWQGFLYARDFLFVMGLDRVELPVVLAALALLFLIDLVSEIKKKEAAAWIYEAALPVRWGLCLILLLAVAVFGMYGPDFDASSFLYINF